MFSLCIKRSFLNQLKYWHQINIALQCGIMKMKILILKKIDQMCPVNTGKCFHHLLPISGADLGDRECSSKPHRQKLYFIYKVYVYIEILDPLNIGLEVGSVIQGSNFTWRSKSKSQSLYFKILNYSNPLEKNPRSITAYNCI